MYIHISLADDTIDFTTKVPADAAHVLEEQIRRLSDSRGERVFVESILRYFTIALADFLDPDLRPPSEKQIAFARAISRYHRVPIPREALTYRQAMFDFLQKYAHNSSGYNRKRSRQPPAV